MKPPHLPQDSFPRVKLPHGRLAPPAPNRRVPPRLPARHENALMTLFENPRRKASTQRPRSKLGQPGLRFLGGNLCALCVKQHGPEISNLSLVSLKS